MDQFTKQTTDKDVITFKTKDKVSVNVYGKPNLDIWEQS
jgi:hypothetical protein